MAQVKSDVQVDLLRNMKKFTSVKVECLVMSKAVFEVISKFSKKITLTKSGCDHVSERHPEVSGELRKMKLTLISPQMIRRSMYNERVWLFYRFFKRTPVTEKYLMVAVELLNDEGLVATSYFTDKIKMGNEVWKEK